MYKKLSFLFLPLFALILHINFIGEDGAHYQKGQSTIAYSYFHHHDLPSSLNPDGQNQKCNRNAIRIKAKHNAAALVLTSIDWVPSKRTYYVTQFLFSNYSSPTFTFYFSTPSLRGPPDAC